MQPTVFRRQTSVSAIAGGGPGIAGLTPCKDSKPFAKRQKAALKELSKRLAKYEKGSAPAIALEATAARTENRFANYAKAGLLCGNDGYPHLIADPGLAVKYGHSAETLLPTVEFLLFAGWLGHSGRSYLVETRNRQQEIIIDVPLALSCLGKGVMWPASVVRELTSGELIDKEVKP